MFEQFTNLVLCGNTGHGKSTIVGHLLVLLNKIQKRELEEAQKEAQRLGDPKHVYAWLVHAMRGEEYQRKLTVRPSRVRVVLEDRTITLIDTPGHANYFQNMILGIFLADYAILVVSANEGPEAQTRDVLYILRSFGIPIVGVAITKMDMEPETYSQLKFEQTKEKIEALLEYVKISRDMPFIPVSGWEGEGLLRYDKIRWFNGPSFLDLIREFELEKKYKQGPLRFAFGSNEVFHVKGLGTVAVGIVESGELSAGDTMLFEPVTTIEKKEITSTTKSLQLAKGVIATPGVDISKAVPRQIVGARLDKTRDWYEYFRYHTKGGIVAGSKANRPSVGSEFECEISLIRNPLWKNSLVKMTETLVNTHVDQVTASILEILEKRSFSDEWKKTTDSAIREGEQAKVIIKTYRPIVLEEVSYLPSFSRFTLRSPREIYGFGSCLRKLG